MNVNVKSNERLKTLNEIKPGEVFYQTEDFLYLRTDYGAIVIKGAYGGVSYFNSISFPDVALYKIAKKVEINIEL